MLFLHLSDIHFHSWSGSKFDLDEDLRIELLADAEQVAGKLGAPVGVLVTGDVAFAGAAEDYLHAKEWLAQLCARFGRTIEIVWSVPGNHDVDRACVSKSALVRDQHSSLRNVLVSNLDGHLAGYLSDPEARDILFRPISEYNRFAGAFGCAISGDKPVWSSEEFALSDGSTLRITGVNSTVVSDGNDGVKNLVIGQYQVPHRKAGVVDIVMCHHPPDCWRDQDTVESALDSRARVQLFGHKHKQRLTQINNTLRLSAGAVHPDRSEPSWQPRYNWLSLDVTRRGPERLLDVGVYPRVWGDDHRFRADLNSCDDGQNHRRITLHLEEWNGPPSEKENLLDLCRVRLFLLRLSMFRTRRLCQRRA